MQNVFLAAIFYASFQVIAGYAASKLSDLWFLIVSSVSVLVVSGVIVAIQLMSGQKLGTYTNYGLLLTFFANCGIGLFTLFLGRAFQQVNPGLVIPTVFGTAILLSTVIGFILSKTMPTFGQIVSLVLISSGLLLLGMQNK